MNAAELTMADVLEAFDRWNGGNPGPAYGAVMLYGTKYGSLEKLVRSVLVDRGLDPEQWQEYASIVSSAFEVWRGLTRPYVHGDEVTVIQGQREGL
jgi:hypothetical protein